MAAIDVEKLTIDNLLAQYRNCPNILAILEMAAEVFQDTMDAIDYLETQDDYTTAEGVHLDILGNIIGCYRPKAPEANYFRLIDYADLPGTPSIHGLRDYDDPESTGGYLVDSEHPLSSASDPDSMMSDAEYRLLIASKVRTFREKATRENIYLSLMDLGADCVIGSPANKEITYAPKVPGSVRAWVKYYAIHYGFKPHGISISWLYEEA